MDPAIQDYAIIGDGRATCLVSREGGIDWLCWPEPDSPALFARLLGRDGGTFRIAPTAPFRTRRRYIEDTNVLVTTFQTADGEVDVTDLMVVVPEEARHTMLAPEHELLRRVDVRRGAVELDASFAPRPGYGARVPELRHRGQLGWRCELGRHLFTLRSDVELKARNASTVGARVVLTEGQTACFSLIGETDQPCVLPPLRLSAEDGIDRTVRWWRRWAARCTYEGPYREAVVRSLLALKLLIFAPSGAVLAAATTSLPERAGGDLNWDYRYCWVRDASLTVRALLEVGYTEEAAGFVSWLLHSTRLTRPELHVLYDVYGRTPHPERTLDHLPGWRGARPVRVGNAAATQLQLDAYGEVIDATARLVRDGDHLDRATRRMLQDFGRFVCEHWQLPDAGIWEPRDEPRHNTHSRLMSWAALDRLIALGERGRLDQKHLERFSQNRSWIREDIEKRGWNDGIGAYTQVLDGESLDASLLLMSWHGFHHPSHPRLRSTYERIVERLGAGGHLLYRYERSREVGEGAFGICSFWAAEHLARGGGTLSEARSCFEAVAAHANDVGLFAEEVDPASGDALGNFPQAFTHVGLVGAALAIRNRVRSEGGGGGG